MGRRDTFLLSILTMVTALAWIAFDIYHASVASTIPAEVEAQLIDISPTFDKATIENVKERRNVDPLPTGGIIITQAPRFTSSPAATNTATQSGL